EVRQLVNLVANALVIEEKVEVVPEVAVAVAVGEELPLAGKKIVVADDEPDFAMFVATVLEDAGATVFTAYDADSAFELVKKEKPDLMTLDLAMPGKTGDKVFVDMRNDPELKSIPVCIISGRPEMRSLIYDRPVPPPEGYLDKPIKEDAILLNIKKIFKIPHSA
ncbi:MAG: response regulator, partial [Pseudomonadota bacterium]